MKKFLIVAAIAILGSVATQAADIKARPVYKKAPVVAPVWSWTGSYIGAYVGGAWADPCTSVPVNAAGVPLFGGGPSCYNLSSSVIAGYTGGYNWQFAPNWLIGYEGETGYIHMRGTGAYPGVPTAFAHTDVGSMYSVWSARFGYIMDKSLFYVKGGGALVRFEDDVLGKSTGGASFIDMENRKYKFGYAVGGGWEYAFDPTWSFKTEYLYLGFGGRSITGNARSCPDGCGPIMQEFASTSSVGIHTVKVGLNHKWDWLGLLH